MTSALQLKNVCKSYKAYTSPADRLREALSLRGKSFHKEISALSDISIDVPKGEVLGVVGHNGAGKSTLLKIAAGLIPPTSGQVLRHGETSTLLDLGAGMNLERSGRDNARFLSKLELDESDQADAMEAAIVEFADIGDMIERPMKYYSTGMRARVAFAAATSIRPDLLIVDEVLAVGDSQFQRKCYARMEALMSEGTTVLFVSHDNQAIVEFCKRAILLASGQLLADGEPATVVKDYLRKLDNQTASDATLPPSTSSEQPENGAVNGTPLTGPHIDPELIVSDFSEVSNSEIKLLGVGLHDSEDIPANVIETGDTVVFRITYESPKALDNVVFPLSIKTKKGVEIMGVRHPCDHSTLTLPSGSCVVQFEFDCSLLQGDYFVSVGVTQLSGEQKTVLYRGDDCFVFRVLPDPSRVRWGFTNIDASSSVLFDQDLEQNQ